MRGGSGHHKVGVLHSPSGTMAICETSVLVLENNDRRRILSRRQGSQQANRMPDVASAGPGWPLDTFLMEKTGARENLAAMGSARPWTGDVGWPLFPEEHPDETALIVKQFLSACATDYGGVIW